ncbi:MAG: hypothetical protein CME60_04105 [Halobacteriovoraceae bacterium]|nr:hypothetical protein [Halobacteriovoraceae bacterium]
MKLAKSKFYFILFIYLTQFILSSCEAPRTTRTSNNGSTSNSVFNYGDGTSSGSLINGTDDEDDDDDDDDDGTSSSISIPSGATSCNWSEDGDSDFEMGGAHLADDETTPADGAYNICQHGSSDTTIYFQIKNPISDEQICFIPMFRSTTGQSTYLGEPRCLMATSNNRIYTIELYKNRSGFTSYDINGVMIMRDKSYFYTSPYPTTYKLFSVDAYLYCANYLAVYGSDAYCQAFANGGNYVFHLFN